MMLIAAFLSITLISCSKDTQKDTKTDKKSDTTTTVNKVNTDEIVAKISTFRSEGEKKLNENKFTKKEFVLKDSKASDDMKQKWEKVDAYYEGDKLVRLQFYPHKGISERTEEFYVMDGKIAFAFIQDKGPKHEGKDMGEPGKEFYFDKDKLIKYVNTSGEKANDEDAEKKMYEAKLPVEVYEIIGVISAK